jgi:hypothetical protein
MKRALAVLGLAALISMCGAGVWTGSRPLVQPFLVSGAQEIQVSVQGWGAEHISYRVPPSSDAWYITVGRALSTHGWRSPTRYVGGPPADPDMYIRVTPFWRVAVWERASLGGSLQAAQITIQRWIVIDWS